MNWRSFVKAIAIVIGCIPAIILELLSGFTLWSTLLAVYAGVGWAYAIIWSDKAKNGQ